MKRCRRIVHKRRPGLKDLVCCAIHCQGSKYLTSGVCKIFAADPEAGCGYRGSGWKETR